MEVVRISPPPLDELATLDDKPEPNEPEPNEPEPAPAPPLDGPTVPDDSLVPDDAVDTDGEGFGVDRAEVEEDDGP